MRKAVPWQWAAVVSLFGAAAFAQAQAIEWQSRFDPIVAPGVEYPGLYGAALPSSALRAAPDGDVFFYALDRLGRPTVSRLRSDLTAVWQRSLQTTGAQRDVLDTFALHDGGTLVVSGGLARFSAEGQLLWSRSLWTQHRSTVLEYADGDLAIADYRPGSGSSASVLRVDGTTGAVIAGSRFDTSCAARLLGVAGETLYVSACDGSVQRLGGDLSTVWRVYGSAVSGVADASGVYVRQSRSDGNWELVKLSSSSGAVLWRRSGSYEPVGFDAEGHLLARQQEDSSARLESIDVATGVQRWSSAWDAVDLIVTPASDGLYVAGTEASGTSGFIARIDRLDGTQIWRTQLQAEVPGQPFLPRGLLPTAQGVLVSGSQCAVAAWCLTGLARVNSANGTQSAVPYPDVPHSVGVSATLDGSNALVLASAEGIGAQQRVRAGQFDEHGATPWQVTFPVANALRGLDWAVALRRADGGAFVTANTGAFALPYLARHESNGSTVWSRSLAQQGYGRGKVSFRLDGAGDLVAGVGRITDVSGHFATFIEKFAAADGQTRWSIPIRGSLGGVPPDVHLLDDDLFAPVSSQTWGIARYSGASAVMQWNNTTLIGASDVFARNGNLGYTGLNKRVVAFSLSDGSLLWSHDVALAGDVNVWLTSALIGDDGDLYATGTRSVDSEQPAFVVRLDGHTGSAVWTQRFDAQVGMPALQATLHYAGEGEVWLTQADDDRTFLTRLDASTGLVIDASLVDMAATRDETVAALGIRYGRRLSDGTILAYGSERQPGQPGVPWAGKLSAPNAGRHGNFSTRFDVPHAGPGSERLSVRFRYDGQAPIESAVGYVQFGESAPGELLPYLTGARDVACVVSGGGTCLAVATPYGIRASLRLEPGAEAHLTADARTMGEQVTAIAEVYAPYGFFETDLLDNRSSQPLGDRLFVDGFQLL
ncbi:MAG TPA: hypothetical protein VMR06_02080 [Dokdonella sp.]|uniref:hypothetical protein n=1 Tax=Dokdonella sp. TaxID=2291710 RepID=UPI002B62B901|nr:hypothetical protein [Dokdonella sp.]HUD40764.1 hypothetical protein [Dokdonella sp.]